MLALIQANSDFEVMARQTVQFITPEVILTIFACAALVLDVMLPADRKRVVAWVSLTGVLLAMASVAVLYFEVVKDQAPRTAFFGMLIVDNYGVAFKIIFLTAAALSILLSIKYLDVEGEQHGEYYSLILFSVVGMMFLASAVDLLTLFISLELMTIPIYILVGYFRRDKRSNEASMKYFLLGAFSSGVLLYGISLVYGLTGSTNLSGIAAALPQVATSHSALAGGAADLRFQDMRYLALLSMTLMAAGMFFKVAAVPFHMWAPDAYEGAPTSITAFMSVGVKAASFAMFGRIFLYGLPDLRNALAGDPANNIPAVPGWALLLGIIAAITIVWGNLAAMLQNNTKRLLAYSSISHAGYVLLGLIAGNQTGYIGVVLYLFIYTLMNLGVFGCIIALRRQGVIGDRLTDLNGLIKKAPGLTIMMTIFLLSLGGIPPTAGFIGKFYLFGGLIETGNPWMVRLAILAVLMTVVSLYYYIRFIRAMYIESETDPQPVVMARPLHAALVVAVFLVLFIGIYPRPFIGLTQAAASSPSLRTFTYNPDGTPATPAVPAPPSGMPNRPSPPGAQR
jgi:NADH-quinone oxidoreductase subunit N